MANVEENRKTAFDYAKDNNHTEIITLLTKRKNPNRRDKKGRP